MPSWSNVRARVSNRLARHLFAAPLRLKSTSPMVSFTFDDIPMSAATVGAPMLEDHGGHGTFYIAGGLVNQHTDQGDGVDPDGIVKLRHSGHEIACHTFSHQRAIDLDASAMAAELEQNRSFLEGLDASIKLENFAYPYESRRWRESCSSPAISARRAASSRASTAARSTCSSCVRRR